MKRAERKRGEKQQPWAYAYATLTRLLHQTKGDEAATFEHASRMAERDERLFDSALALAIETCRRDMAGDALPGGGQMNSDAPGADAPARQPDAAAGEGQVRHDAQSSTTQPAAAPVAEPEEGQVTHDAHAVIAPSGAAPNSGEAGQDLADARLGHARPAASLETYEVERDTKGRFVHAVRTEEQKLAALKASGASARAALYKIDGTDIRDFTIGQCLTAHRHKERDAYVLRVLGNRFRHEQHTLRISDVASDDMIRSIVEQAGEYANAFA